jgi:hypothetical protein
MLRLLCRDFRGKTSHEKFISDSGMRSLRSMFVEREAKLLYKISTLVERLLISVLYPQSRRENRLFFMTAVTIRLVALVSLTELSISPII